MNENKEKGRVIYFDPNNISLNAGGDTLSNIFSGTELFKNPEDLSIAVDLEVTRQTRGNVLSKDNRESYSLVKNEPINNFLKGKNIGDTNVLSDFFTGIHYDKINNEFNDEALCINSIDIEFTSWYVASVIIKFTDVRGNALFSQSEHNETTTNKKVSEGNLFSSFFTMPYPIFNLKIKGFYGNSVNYPLHMQDFKAEYNSEKGNFDVTAQFIGYTYAMLSDIQMTYLISAPYADMYGAKYWDEQVNNGRFKTLEGDNLIKIPELLKKIKEGEFVKTEINGSDEKAVKVDSINKRLVAIKNIKDLIKNYIDSFKLNYNVIEKSTNSYEIETVKDKKVKTLTPSSENDIDIYPKLKLLHETINQFINEFPDDTLFTKYKGDEAKKYFQIKDIKTKNSLFSGKLNINEIMSAIDLYEKDSVNIISDLNKDIANKIEKEIENVYGLTPSIYNLFKILLAHMETLIHCIGQCADDITKNEKREFAEGMEGTDFVNNKLLPFPWFTYDNKDEWIGKYHPDFSEVKLVKSLIKAKQHITTEIEKIETIEPESDIKTDESTVAISDVWFPINAFDNSISSLTTKTVKPYSNLIRENGLDINELKAILSTRITTIVGLSSKEDDLESYNSFSELESLNIISELGSTEEHIDKVILALNKIKQESNKFDTYTLLRNVKNGYYGYSFLNTKGIIPLSDMSVVKLKETFPNSIPYYADIVNQTNPNYKPVTVKILDGVDNCDYIYDNWYSAIKLQESNNNNLSVALRNINLDKNNVINSLHKKPIYDNQFLMNTLTYKKPISNSENESRIKSFYLSCGFNYENEIKTTDTKKDIITSVFSENNSNFNNLYKLYLGKDDVNAVRFLDEKYLKTEELLKTNYNDLSYPFIGGNFVINKKHYTDKKRVKNIPSLNTITNLFGNVFYYAQNNRLIGKKGNSFNKELEIVNRLKAFLFLQTLPVDINGNSIKYKKLLIDSRQNKNSFMVRTNKTELLFIGSMLWRRKYDTKNSPNIYNDETLGDESLFKTASLVRLPDTSRMFRINNEFTLSNKSNNEYEKCLVLDLIPKDSNLDKNLIKYFEDWVDDKSESDSWNNIHESFEFKKKNSNTGYFYMTEQTFISFCENFLIVNNLEYLIRVLYKNFIENYSIIEPLNPYMIGLINRDESNGVSSVVKLVTNESIIAYSGDNILYPDALQNSSLKVKNVNYLIDRISNLMNKQKNDIKNITGKLPEQMVDDKTSMSAKDDEDIELQVYKYLKILYDKWVSGYEFNTNKSSYKWINTEKGILNGYSGYNIKNFKFMDRSYHNIGHKFVIDYNKFLNNFIGLTQSKTLYSSITDILSENNFLFIPMPNYQSWDNVNDFIRVFEPIPYNKSNISNSETDFTSIFLCMYTGEPSSKLDVNDGVNQFKNSSFNFSDDKDIPSDYLSTSDMINDNEPNYININKVPVFTVSNGKQNQSYFKNIIVNQNNPATTDTTIGVLNNLNNINDKSAGVTTINQNLYSLYSQYSYTCDVEMLGCAQIQPMMYFQLTNMPMWNGAYLIYRVKHSITPGNMRTNFTGMRMGKTYPKLISPKVISHDDMNNTNNWISPNKDEISTLSKNTKLGKYFTLSDYTINETEIPVTIVERLKNNVAPTLDSIYESWAKSDLNQGYGKFRITSGYRNKLRNSEIGGSKTSQHIQGLAIDIQLVTPSESGNNALFEHIKQRMRNGLKMDQLIKEPSSLGGWCHVSPVMTDGVNAYIRGQALVFDNNYKTIRNLSETIPEAQKPAKLMPKKELNGEINNFIEYWKSVENNIKSGWKESEKKWYAHPSPEGGAPTIGYGIKLIESNISNQYIIQNLQSIVNGQMGITESMAIDEITNKVNKALIYIKNKINKKYGAGSYDKIKERYKMAMVDLHLNTGNVINEWPIFVKAAVDNNINEMLNNCDRYYYVGGVKKPLIDRNKKFKQFIKS